MDIEVIVAFELMYPIQGLLRCFDNRIPSLLKVGKSPQSILL